MNNTVPTTPITAQIPRPRTGADDQPAGSRHDQADVGAAFPMSIDTFASKVGPVIAGMSPDAMAEMVGCLLRIGVKAGRKQVQDRIDAAAAARLAETCPPWCTTHAGGAMPGEPVCHFGRSVQIGHVDVSPCLLVEPDGCTERTVFVDGEDLTVAQARALAEAIRAAADQAESATVDDAAKPAGVPVDGGNTEDGR